MVFRCNLSAFITKAKLNWHNRSIRSSGDIASMPKGSSLALGNRLSYGSQYN